MMYSLILDIVMVVLLVATIGYAMVLNRKLGNLRRHKDELERLAATFADSTQRAKESIAGLKSSTTELQTGIAKATGLKDDLKFLIDRGTSTADHLEGVIRESRSEVSEKTAPARAATGASPRSVEAIADAMNLANEHRQKNAMAENEKLTADKIGPAERNGDDDVRSRAEKELIEALRTAR